MVGRCSAQTGHAGKRREFGEGRGRGGPRKDLPGPDSGLSRLLGGGGLGGLREGRCGTHATPALPERQGAYSRIRVKLSVER